RKFVNIWRSRPSKFKIWRIHYSEKKIHRHWFIMQKEVRMLNRSIAPDFSPIKGLTLIRPDRITYGNGLEAFVFQAPQQELLKFEFVFNNVFDAEEQPVFNTAMAAMLKEGTTSLSSAEIAEKIDFYEIGRAHV